MGVLVSVGEKLGVSVLVAVYVGVEVPETPAVELNDAVYEGVSVGDGVNVDVAVTEGETDLVGVLLGVNDTDADRVALADALDVAENATLMPAKMVNRKIHASVDPSNPRLTIFWR